MYKLRNVLFCLVNDSDKKYESKYKNEVKRIKIWIKSKNLQDFVKVDYWDKEKQIDLIKSYAKKEAIETGVENLTHFKLGDVSKRWEFQENFFDIAIDSLTAVGLHEEERGKCRDEMYRTLKKGGIVLIRVVSSDDEFEKELMAKYPGDEPNSSIWPEINKFQKNFSEDELKNFYKNFDILILKKLTKRAFKAGRDFTATNWWVILQKP